MVYEQLTQKDDQKHCDFVTKVKVRYLKDLNKVNKKIEIVKNHRSRSRQPYGVDLRLSVVIFQ